MRRLSLLVVLFFMLVFSAVLEAITEVTDEWVDSCITECTGAGDRTVRCDRGEIRFIADQYARAMKGEPYWETSGGKRFANHVECAEYRMNEIRAICPAAFEYLRKSLK